MDTSLSDVTGVHDIITFDVVCAGQGHGFTRQYCLQKKFTNYVVYKN